MHDITGVKEIVASKFPSNHEVTFQVIKNEKWYKYINIAIVPTFTMQYYCSYLLLKYKESL